VKTTAIAGKKIKSLVPYLKHICRYFWCDPIYPLLSFLSAARIRESIYVYDSKMA